MTKKEYQSAIYDVIYLAGCVVNNRIPDQERVKKINPDHPEQHFLCCCFVRQSDVGLFRHGELVQHLRLRLYFP